MRRLVWALALLLISSMHCIAAGYQSLSSNDGKVIEAKVIDYIAGKSVDIETKSGDVYKGVSLDRFNAQTISYFNQWAAERKAKKDDAPLTADAKITIFVTCSRDDDLNVGGDPDNREVVYEPAITFDNKDKDLSHRAVSGTLVLIGESVLKNREYHILYKEDFVVDLLANSRTRWAGKSFTNTYDDYARNGSAFGAKYESYLLVLRDKEGNATLIKTPKTRWRENYKSILRADTSNAYSPDFTKSFEKTKV